MPEFDVNDDLVLPTTETSATEADHAGLVEQRAGARPGVLGGLVGSIGLSIPDFVDQTASSLIPGIDRGDINSSFLSAIGSPKLNQFASENRGAVEILSGIEGMVAADRIAGRLMKPGGLVASGLRAMPGLRNVVALNQQYDRALRTAQFGLREVAARGEMGAKSFSGVVSYRAMGVPLALDVGKAKTATRGFGTLKGVADAAVFEGVFTTIANQNSVFFSNDWTENVANATIGLVAGGGLGRLQAGWALRRAANSDSVLAETLKAYDPRGFEASRRLQIPSELADGKKFLGFDNGLLTDIATSRALHASELRLATDSTERGIRLGANRNDFATSLQSLMFQDLNKVTQDGLHSVGKTGFNDSQPAFKALKEGITREPTLIYGASEIGVAPIEQGIKVTDASRKLAIEAKIEGLSNLIKQGGKKVLDKDGVESIIPLTSKEREEITVNLRKLWYDNSKHGLVQLFPGELAPLEFGSIVDNLPFRRIKTETSAGKTIFQAEKIEGHTSTLGVGDDLVVYTDGNKPIHQLSMHDTIQLYKVARQATDRIAKGNTVVTLPAKPTWFQLDMAERIIQKSGRTDLVTFPQGMSREDAIVESFAQKVDAIRGTQAAPAASEAKMFGKQTGRNRPPANDVAAFAARVKYNLPQFTPAQAAVFKTHENPVEMLMYGFKNGDEVRQLGIAGLKAEVKNAATIQGLTDDLVRDFEAMNGRSFDFMMTGDGEDLVPLMVYKRPMSQEDWSRKALDEGIALRKAYQRGLLTSQTSDPFNRALVTALTSDSNFQQALKIGELADFQHSSIIPGLGNQAPQSFFGSLTNAISTREWRDRDILTMLSASRIKDLQDRLTRGIMAQTIQDTMGDIATRIAAPRAGQSRVTLNHFFSQRPGWDIVKPVDEDTKLVEVALPSGERGWGFQLDKTAKNRERWERQFGEAFPEEGSLLVNGAKQPVILDDLALEALTRFQALADFRREAQNSLLRAQNRPEIQRQDWWVPSVATHGKFIAMTFDATNNVVPGWGVVANTVTELDKRMVDLTKRSGFQNGWTVKKRESVTNFMDLWDKAQMDWHDVALTPVAAGKVNRGRLTSQDIDLHAWDRANAMMVDGFIDHGRDVLRFLTKDAVDAARIRADVGRVETAVGRSGSDPKYGGIFDRYVQNITGMPSGADRNGIISKVFSAVETNVDSFLRDVTPSSAKVYDALKDKFRMIPWAKNETNQKLFDKLTKDLGPYMPFRSVSQLVEAQTGHALPKEFKEISAKISWYEATSKLRWLESVHAIMNFGSLVHNLPSVTKSLQKFATESSAEHAKRIGHAATIFGDEAQVAVVNPAKLMYMAMKDSRATHYDEFTKLAMDRGYMNQEVAELERQWSVVKTPGALRSFFFGNPNADPSTLAGKIAKKGGLDYYLGFMSDKSEEFTRRMAMYYGKRVAELNGINRVEDQVNYAHDIANKVIANYDPRNRSELFQGALGAPIGLFQSYVVNYYQRLFRMFETKDTRALASQALWQSAVFGIHSFGPFWSAANSMFFDRGEALEDMTDSFENRLGTADADILSYGLLANMPKLFNLLPGVDGVSGANIYTRGDINVRLPVANMPIADSIKKTWDGLHQLVDAFTETNQHLTTQQIAEVLSNSLGNRPLAGMIEIFGAGGYDTDPSGQVVSRAENFLSMDTAYRFMGVKSMAQQKDVDAFYANKQAQEEQSAFQTALRLATRSNIRAGNFDALPDLFASYVENGGKVDYFTRWYNDAMESALETRSQRQLDDVMKDDKKMAQINRLLDAGVTAFDEASIGDEDYGQADDIKQRTKDRVDAMFTGEDPAAQTQEDPGGIDFGL